MVSQNDFPSRWAGLVLFAITVFPAAAWAAEPEGRGNQSRKTAQEESLKDLEARAKKLAAEGLPKKTPEERQKESKPIIPEDCVIEVVSWHPANPKKETFTDVYEIRGGVVTSKRPPRKIASREGETFRSEGYEETCVFEGRLQGNAIVGTWKYETPWHQNWGWANTEPEKITSHTATRTICNTKVHIELHLDGTVTIEESGEGVTEINHIIGANPGVRTIRHSWPNETTPPEWRQPGQGVWQFRKAAAVPAKPEEKPVGPSITTADPQPPKLSLPKEKPLSSEPASQAVRSEASSEEKEIDRLPPSLQRKFAALSVEKRGLFIRYYRFGVPQAGRLLEWLSDEKLPLKEVEIRANLLLVTEQRYRQFYTTILSKAVDNYVEGLLWRQVAKLTPIARYVSLVKELATIPWDIAVVASKYQNAAEAESVLNRFIQTWGKSEEEAVDQLFQTKKAIAFWERTHAQARKRFDEAQALVPSATANRLPSTPEERRAAQAMQEAHQTMSSASKELKELNLEAMAWELRITAIRGDWKKWIVDWEK